MIFYLRKVKKTNIIELYESQKKEFTCMAGKYFCGVIYDECISR